MHARFVMFILAAAAAFAPGCAEIPATNPHDPNTPASQIAKGAVSGEAQLVGEFNFDVLEATVELRAPTAPGEPAYTTEVGSDGAFLIESVVPGPYTASVQARGFSSAPQAIEVPIGGAVEDLQFRLVPITDGAIRGVARLANGLETGHGGLRVEAIGKPFTTLTGDDGAFLLAVTEGVHDLRVSAAGYDPATLAGVQVEGGQTVNLEEPLVLTGAPASLRGVLKMQPGFADETRLATARITLTSAAGLELVASPTVVKPDGLGPEGVFVFDTLVPGEYRLSLALEGFHTDSRTLDLPVGSFTDLGETTLFVEAGAAPAVFVGQVQRVGQPEDGHGGTRVEAIGTPWVTLTNASGDWQLSMPAASYTFKYTYAGHGTETSSATRGEAGVQIEVDAQVLSGLPGSVEGSVSLADSALGDAQTLQGVDIALIRAGDDAPFKQTQPDARGVFTLSSIPPGQYTLSLRRDGFTPRELPVQVAVGERLRIGQLVLEPVEMQVAITGRARVEGQAEHAGIIVRLMGTGLQVQTGAAGDYRIEAPLREAEYALQLSFPNHNTALASAAPPTQAVVDAALADGALVIALTADPEEVALLGLPGQLRGSVALEAGFADRDALARVDISLIRQEDNAPIAQQQPNAEGGFIFDAVPAGQYLIVAGVDGFTPRRLPVTIDVGQTVDIGQLLLQAVQVNVALRGQAQLEGRADHSGIEVTLLGTGQRSVTGADGRYALLAPLREEAYTLQFFYAGRNIETARAEAPSPEVVTDALAEGALPIELMPAPALVVLAGQPGTIRGSVALPAGFGDVGTLALIDVTLVRPEDDEIVAQTRPSAEGVFILEGIQAGEYAVEAQLDGFVSRRLPIIVNAGQIVDLGQVLLEPVQISVAIEGIALLEGRADHSGVEITLEDTALRTVTDAAGAFRLEAPLRAGDYALRFDAPGYNTQLATASPPTQAVVDAAIAAEALPIVIAPQPAQVSLTGLPGSIRGSVALEAGFGNPLDSIDIDLVRLSDEQVVAQTRPNARGAFVFDAIPAGSYLIEARLDGFAPRQAPIDVDVAQAASAGQLLLTAIEIRVAITGRAQRAGAADHRGIVVALEDTALTAQTDANGDFLLIAPLRAAQYRLNFSVSGYNTETATAQPPSAQAVRDAVAAAQGADPDPLPITATPSPVALSGLPGRVRGRVTLAPGFDDVQLLRQVSVRLLDFDAAGPAAAAAQTSPDAEGFYLFDAMPAGQYLVEFALVGFLPQSSQLVLEPGGSVIMESRVMAPDVQNTQAFLQGTATLACEGQCDSGGIRVEVLNTPFVGLTNSDGLYRIEVVEGQGYTLSFSAPGYLEQQRGGLDAAAGEITPVADVQLTARPGTIRALAFLRGLSTAPRLQAVDVTLWTDPPGAQPVRSTNPSGDGQVLFDNIVPGSYLVRADATGYGERTLRAQVGPGEVLQIGVLDLPHQSSTQEAVPLTGLVTLQGAELHSGTEIRVTIAGAGLALGGPLITNAQGGFEISASPEERYMVSIVRPGYAAVPAQGPFVWDPNQLRFEAAGQPLALSLLRNPVSGGIDLSVNVLPAWLPAAERYVRVRLDGPVSQTLERVTHRENVSFGPLPEGVYSVSVERPGFTTTTRIVDVTISDPDHDLGAVTVSLIDLALARLDLRGESLRACDLRVGLSVRGANLSGARLTGDFGRNRGCAGATVLGGIDLSEANLSDADLTGASFSGAANDPVSLANANLSGARLAGVDMNNLDGRGAEFFGATASRVNFAGADLTGANFTGADLSAAAFVLKGDPPGDGPWPRLAKVREALPMVPCDARERRPAAQLSGATFARANLTAAFLPGLDLSNAAFAGARLNGADLRHTCLTDAQLMLIDLSDAVLDGADMARAELTGALLRATSIRGVDLHDASLVNTVIDQADIRLSPRAACDQPPAWGDYEPRGRCYEVSSELCNCRTRMGNVSLDGANLIGASFQGVDMADTSMLGVTFGRSNRMAFIQPPSCLPERYLECAALWPIYAECKGPPPMTQAEWEAVCAANPLPGGNNLGALLGDVGTQAKIICVLNDYADQLAGAGCRTDPIANCIDPNAYQPPRTWSNQCTWDNVVLSNEDPDRTLGDTCIFEGRTHLMPACQEAPTVLEDTRLDRAEMVAVALNGVELRSSRLVDTVLRNSVFVENRFELLDFSGADFTDASMSNTDLSQQDFVGTNFTGARLRQVNFYRADLTGADFTDAVLRGSTLAEHPAGTRPLSFERADLRDTFLRSIDWAGDAQGQAGPNFDDADLSGATIEAADFSYGRFYDADLSDTTLGQFGDPINFRSAQMGALTMDGMNGVATFDRAYLADATISDSALYGSTFIGAIMDRVRLEGVEAGRTNFQHASFAGARLRDAIIDDSAFRYVNFSAPEQGPCGGQDQPRCAANLYGALGSRNDFDYANFNGACLRDAVLSDSSFTNTTFQAAYLRDADFSGGSLGGADFRNAVITGASFRNARLGGANLTNTCGVNGFGLFDGANLTNTRICVNYKGQVESRSTYIGTPIWVGCGASNCPPSNICN